MENKFLPLSVETIESHLNVVFVENSEFSEDLIRPLRKNIAYNIQYIQYLNKVIMEEEFTSVLLKMNIKSFIIHCSSIVEGLLYFLVVSHGYAEKKYWVQVSSVKTNEYQIDTSSYFQEINIFKKTSNQQKPNLTFDQLQKKAEKKKILGDDHNLYALISKIR